MLFDTPTGVREAAKVLADAGVADRCEIATGDFFTAVPGGGDAYVRKSVIHDWAGGRARTEAEYAALLDSADLELTAVGAPLAPTHFQVLEAAPR